MSRFRPKGLIVATAIFVIVGAVWQWIAKPLLHALRVWPGGICEFSVVSANGITVSNLFIDGRAVNFAAQSIGEHLPPGLHVLTADVDGESLQSAFYLKAGDEIYAVIRANPARLVLGEKSIFYGFSNKQVKVEE